MLSQGFDVRPYDESDAAAVAGCLTSGAAIDATLLPVSEDEWRGFTGRAFNNGARDFAVAERNGVIVATLMSTRVERDGEQLRSFRIIVHPEHRRLGIATKMFLLVESQDPARDTAMRAEMPGKWTVGAGMLERRGFSIIEELIWMRADDPPAEARVPDGFLIRPYGEGAEDDEAWRRLNREAYEGTSDFTDLVAEERDAIRKEPRFHMWVAERDGERVGTCHTKQFGGDSYINSLVVTRECRGNGLGRALLLEGMRTLHAQAPGPIRLNVRAENEHAVALYKSTGFAVEDSLHEWQRRPGQE